MPLRSVALVLLTAASLVWLAAVVQAAPLVRRSGQGWAEGVAAFTYVIGSVVCHQQGERSFHTDDVRWPVCARCTGLYLGASIGLVLAAAGVSRRWRRPEPRVGGGRGSTLALVTVAIAAPTAITGLAALAGLFDLPNVWRAVLAVPLGAWIGVVVGAVVAGDLR